MLIPVEVQKPCQPQTARVVGEAHDYLRPEDVANEVGVPEGCFMEGKILKRRGERRWSLVAACHRQAECLEVSSIREQMG